MQRGMGLILALLGLFLVVSMAGIVAAAVREARLPPAETASPTRRRRALVAAAATLAVMALFVWAGNTWWNVEARTYAGAVYHPLAVRPVLSGNVLDLLVSPHVEPDPDRRRYRSRANDDFIPDHGHLMHLYAIRQPGMDAAFHLHPTLASPGDFRLTLPSMPPGTYKLYGDVVHSNGFPETLLSTITIPANLPPVSLDPEDASAAPPPLSSGNLPPSYKLPDGYTMTWDRPADLTASTGYALRFHLLDPSGHPAQDMQPYLGMAGHAAFVKADGSTFAHTHPEGSAAMQAMELANPDAMPGMTDMPSSSATASPAPHEPISPTVDFPYGFPSPGRYRIFIQMKHANTVETGVFDAEVH